VAGGMNLNKSFLGVGWGFPPTFSKATAHTGGQATMVEAEEDIHESLTILLSTTPGERIMLPTYGCGLKAHVFEDLNESVITEIKDTIRRAVLFFEPRITLNAIRIDDADMLGGQLNIHLDYNIRGTNTRSNMVYPFYFLEGSNVPDK
jgi:phage baseplate assembly protein W